MPSQQMGERKIFAKGESGNLLKKGICFISAMVGVMRIIWYHTIYINVGGLAMKKRLLCMILRSVYKELHADRETGC